MRINFKGKKHLLVLVWEQIFVIYFVRELQIFLKQSGWLMFSTLNILQDIQIPNNVGQWVNWLEFWTSKSIPFLCVQILDIQQTFHVFYCCYCLESHSVCVVWFCERKIKIKWNLTHSYENQPRQNVKCTNCNWAIRPFNRLCYYYFMYEII